MRVYVFPGQGAQFVGMGKDLYDQSAVAKDLFERANDVLGFRITDVMFNGTAEELRQTHITQPAVFLHSVIAAKVMATEKPNMVAGHSLGEYSALVACEALSFEDALVLVSKRAKAMQAACEIQPSTMAVVLGLPDEVVGEVCDSITDQVVVAANYNCPGQIAISGTIEGVEKACELLKAKGAKRALRLNVGGAFHSPLMQPAAQELRAAIMGTDFKTPICPIYQNVNAYPQTNPIMIQQNLVAQLTAPVHWTQTIRNMILDGATEFYEFGPGDVLKNLIHRIDPKVTAE